MDAQNMELPFLETPHDTFRFGLSHLRDDVLAPHPAAAAFQRTSAFQQQMRQTALENTYGTAFCASRNIERQILAKHKRLPGLPSSHVGLQSLTGDLDRIELEDVLGYGDKETAGPLSLHERMEKSMGLPRP